MNQQDLKRIPQLTMHNHKAIEESENCGCYCCLAVFSKHDITQWTDWGDTALCPKCGVDAVLPQTSGIALEVDQLQEIHDFWLGKK